MKISKNTLSVLKSFSNINRSILIDVGNQISTVSNARNIFARFGCQEQFPVKAPIYDLNEFLKSVDLFEEDPEMDFRNDSVVLESGGQTLTYVYADEANVPAPPSLEKLKEFEPKVSGVVLDNSVLNKLQKAASVLGTDVLWLENEGGKLSASLKDSINSSSNSYKIDVGEVEGQNFKVAVLVEYLKMVPLTYSITLYENFIRLESTDVDLEYIIAIETNSTWG